MIALGETFLLGHGGRGDHLWIVIAQVTNYPEFKDKNLLIVNLTSKRDGCDTSCILVPGDHPFIEHETVVYYCDMHLVKNSQIEQDIFDKKISSHNRCSQKTLKRIIDGALSSPYTKRKYKSLLVDSQKSVIDTAIPC